MKQFTEFGKHYLVEFSKCHAASLSRVGEVQDILLDAARKSDATIIDHHFHQFQPHGVSGVILIAESHFSIHTWPESGYVAVDIFTCGSQLKADRAIEVLKKRFEADEVQVREVPRGTELSDSAIAPAPVHPTPSPLLYTLTLIVAACSIVYELLIAQTVSLLAANTVQWYSMTIGIFLCAMGIGSLLCDKFARGRNPWSVLFVVECLLALVGVLAVPFLRAGHMLSAYVLGNQLFSPAELPFFVSAFTAMAAIGLLTGFEIPLLIRVVNRERRNNLINRVLGVDYLGALIGGVIFPLLLIPYFSVMTIGIAVALVNFLVAMAIQFSRPQRKPWHVPMWLGLSVAVIAAAIFAFAHRKDVQQYFLQKFYYYQFATENLRSLFLPNSDLPEVKRYMSPYQKIDIVQAATTDVAPEILDAYSTKFQERPEYPRGVYLYLNGDFQLFSDTDEIYHEYFAHVPIIRTGKVPRHVLVLGGGDGILIKELLKHPGIEKITHVDLDHVLVKLAEEHPTLLAMNRGSLLDPRVKNVFGDGFQFVRNSSEQFDAVYIDFPYAVDYNLSKLYSKEFYHFVTKIIAPGGFAAVDSPGVGTFTEPDLSGRQFYTTANDWPFYGQTLKAAGFRSIVPYVSNLEADNERALQIVRESLGPEAVDLDGNPFSLTPRESAVQDVMARQMLGAHVYSLQQGFILLGNEDLPEREYWDPGIKLHVLNEMRYRRAFQLPFPPLEEQNRRVVNSIMRPTLPNLPFWFLRMP